MVLGAEPMLTTHTADDYLVLLEKLLEEYEIDKNNVSFLVRDGDSTMNKLAKLFKRPSFHCFAHNIQLVSYFHLIHNTEFRLSKARSGLWF